MKKIWLILLLLPFASIARQEHKKHVTMDDVWKDGTFRPKYVSGFNAMSDGERYTQLDGGADSLKINIYKLADGRWEKQLLNTAEHLFNGKALQINEYAFSHDEQKLLLFTELQNIYRRSVLSRVYVYDIASGNLSLLDTEKVLHAQFSPDGKHVAFVKHNNLYYKNLASGKLVQVTIDGKWNKIINGNCDWVYEEEWEFTQAYQWSPDSKKIAYYRFNESKVPEYTMIRYYNNLYPEPYKYKYPKAGEPNSRVSIRFYDLEDKTITKARLGSDTDQYIPRIKWTNDPNTLCIYRMNRQQNRLELLFTDATTGRSKTVYEEENKYYIEINDNLAFLPDNKSFIFNSERDGYNHLYRYDIADKNYTDLTKGKYDIETIIGIDNDKKLVYYTAAVNSPLEKKLYATDWNGEQTKLLTPEEGTHHITPCAGYRYFLDNYSSTTRVPVFSLRDGSGKIVRTLEDNKELETRLKKYSLGKLKMLKIPVSNETELNAWMITPPDFNPAKKYPVLMYQYSGPGSQTVADEFVVRDLAWHQMLAAKGYIIVCADGTGTGYRGEDFKKKTYLQLGKLESDDQIAVAKWLGRQSYVDRKRIGIWGWSFGGFMSSTCIMKGADVFKMAIAVAPVTNWRYYDNIYTERYMRTPQENKKGYDENAPEYMAEKLKGKFLLIHGTGDDNVHFQNSVMLVNQLIKYNKEYDSEYYPDRTHGISGGNTRYHLYTRMTKFIMDNL